MSDSLHTLNSRTWWIPVLLLSFYLAVNIDQLWADEQFEIPADDYLSRAFNGDIPQPAVIWLTGALKDDVNAILGHNYTSLRVRYWKHDQRVAWILEEIGKERPITAGFIVKDDRLENVQVLAFRESRGWEIRFESFTRQFNDVGLKSPEQLDKRIDGISGATLSVNAMRKLAAMALLLTQQVMK